MMKLIKYTCLIFLFGSIGCKKFVEIPPPSDQISSEVVFSNDISAESAIMGLYSEMINNSRQITSGYTTLFAGLCADEMYYFTNNTNKQFEENELTISSHSTIESSFWIPAYKHIYAANFIIQGVQQSNNLSLEVKSTLEGEARVIRSFVYFLISSLFGDVPLLLTTDYSYNAIQPRTEIDAVLDQIVSDLQLAIDLLPQSHACGNKGRINKYAASLLLAKVQLYRQNWSAAADWASDVIDAGFLLEPNLDEVFLPGSSEAIWQLQPVNPRYNTHEAFFILPASSNTTPTFLLRQDFIDSFESGDNRLNEWVGSRTYGGQTLFYPYKYKVRGGNTSIPLTEWYTVLRLADAFLIRAEANAQLNNLADAEDDMNAIRLRAGLPVLQQLSKEALLGEILKQRKFEFIAEWGNRWFDLRRTGKVNNVLQNLKPLTWQDADQLWPIPQGQIIKNSALVQNPGY